MTKSHHGHGHDHHSNDNLQQLNDPTLFYQPPSEESLKKAKGFHYVTLLMMGLLVLVVVVCMVLTMILYYYIKPLLQKISDGQYKTLRNTAFVFALGGLRYDFIDLYAANCPTIHKMKSKGVHVKKLRPVFPTTLFPNAWTIATGKYPGSHGILGDRMYDRVKDEEFKVTNVEEKWWNGSEPIWTTLHRFNYSSLAQYWPGSNVIKPDTYEAKYKEDNDYKGRIDRILAHLDADLRNQKRVKREARSLSIFQSASDYISNSLFSDTPTPAPSPTHATTTPTLLYMGYYAEIDVDVHNFGPQHEQVAAALGRFDAGLKYFFKELTRREIDPYSEVNIIVLGDHGVAALEPDCFTHISELLSPSERGNFKFENQGGYLDMYALSSTSEEFIDEIYLKLKILEEGFNYTVYKKDDIPEDLRVKNAYAKYPERTPDLWILMDEHCSMAYRFYDSNLGDHGYSNHHDSMASYMVATGPTVASHVEVDELHIINVYPFLVTLLGMADSHLIPAINGSFSAIDQLLTPKK